MAASCAVFVPSGNRRTSGVRPAARAASVNRSIAPLIVSLPPARRREPPAPPPPGAARRRASSSAASGPTRSLERGHHHAVGRDLGATAHDDGRNARELARGQDPRRRLAVEGLGVERPFPGDHQIGPGDPGREPHGIHHHLDPRPQPRAAEGQQTEPQPARGAGAGLLVQRDPEVTVHDGCEMAQGSVQQEHILGRGPLLRPVHGARSRGAGQAGCPRHTPRSPTATRARGAGRWHRSAGGPATRRRQGRPRRRLRRGSDTRSARAMPVPPSFVALPPRHTSTREAPSSMARTMSSPVPRVDVRPG